MFILTTCFERHAILIPVRKMTHTGIRFLVIFVWVLVFSNTIIFSFSWLDVSDWSMGNAKTVAYMFNDAHSFNSGKF